MKKDKNGFLIKLPFLILLLTGLLSSCSTPKRPQQTVTNLSPEEAWQQNKTKLNSINEWHSEGRIAVSRKQEGESASFTWQQFSDQFFLKLFGPFGAGAMELDGTLVGPNKRVTLRQGNQISYAATAEDLLYQQVKWRVPLTGLTYWVKGVPVPNHPVDYLILNTDGSIKEVNQLGWRITYAKYDFFEEYYLPTRIHLISDELEVKLAIRNWKDIK